ncbi:MAG: lamin tail domain-containing protein [Anaerolineae bacterium]|nr:lamin tail domain-containing protein [Anaerolineae bacterium]
MVAATAAGFAANYPGFSGVVVSLEGNIGNGLSNSGDRLVLRDGSGSEIDALSWGSDTTVFNPAAPDVAEGHSLERDPANADTDSASDFVDQATPAPGQVRTVSQGPQIVINEIMIDPAAVDDSLGEWFELYNAGSAEVNLQGWRISSGTELHTISASLVIPAGGYVVLGNNGDTNTNGGLTVNYVYSGITLDNTADTLSLVYGDGQTADSVSYNNTDFLISPGASIQLIDPSLDNSVGANWRRAHTVWSGSAGDRGTPGAPNNADTTPPMVSSTSPANGATGVDLNTNVTATFSEAMDETAVTADVFTLTTDGTPVPGAFSYDPGTNTITFDPTDPLAENTAYTARVEASVMDLAGNRMAAPYTWSFTTAAVPTPTPTPPPTLPNIVINEIMQNPAKVDDSVGEWFELYNAGDVAVDINGWTIRDDGSDSHVINNGGPLVIPAYGFLVLARNGDPAVNGGLLADYVYSNFVLGNNDDEIVLLNGSGQEVDRVNYDGGPNFPDPTGASMALWDPSLDNNVGSNWTTSSQPYGLGDLGTPGQPNFGANTTPPKVAFTRPANGATNVPLDSTVSAIFNEAMDPTTFTTETFTLTGPAGPVAGTVTCEGAIATFTPDAPLEPETPYTAWVSGSVTDLASNPLGADYSWSFTTGVFVPAPVLISEVQVRGPNGASDEFIELYNPSATDDFDLNGYRIDYQATTGTINSRYTWISPTIIPPHRHYLLVNSTGYSGTVAGDATYSAGIADDGALAIVRVTDGAIIDSVGWGDIHTSFVEWQPAPAPASGQSIERKPGGNEGNGQDTNDNSVDFQVISPPNPQNLASPPVPPIGPPFVPIYEIQGDGFVSPYADQQVTTAGVVIADFQDTGKNGFFIQDVAGDGNPVTSDGIFVYEGGNTVDVALGDTVTVVGTVSEYYGNTQIVLQTVAVDSAGNPLPAPVELNPPFDDAESLAYYEALEGMLVSAPDCVVVGPTSAYGEFVVVRADLGIERVFQDDPAGTGERIMVDDEGGLRYYVKVGDRVEGLIGPLDYTFNNYKVQQRDALTVTTAPDPGVPAPPDLAADEFSVVTFNLENLFDTVDEPEKDDPVLPPEEYELKLTKLGAAINAMGGPVILAVEEAENVAVLTDLAAKTGVNYQVTLVDGPDARGIDVGLLTRSDRVTVLSAEVRQTCTTLSDGLGPGQGYCPDGQNMLFSRPPLVVHLTVDGFPLTVIVNHFKSKSEDTLEQQVTLPRRVEQAQWVASLVNEVLATDPRADVIVLGDLNDFLDAEPLAVLTGAGLRDVLLDVDKSSRYTYIYNGESEVLDHVLISADLEMEFQGALPFHINADFPVPEVEDTTLRKSSDHDPVLTWFRLAPVMAAFTAEPVYALVGQDVVFTNQSTGDEPLTFLWDFGDGTSSTEANPTHAYAAEGDYTVTLTVSNAWSGDQASAVIHVGLAPDAAFSYSPGAPWVGQKVTFTNKSTGTEPLSYDWDFGDGEASTETNPQHVYAEPGTYRVCLTATNPWGSDTATAEITVSQPPLSVDVWHMVIHWLKWGGRNVFVTSGKLELPSGYSRNDLQHRAVVSIKIGGKTASEEVVFRKQKMLWIAIREKKPDGSLDVALMTIHWKPGHYDRQAVFSIIGVAELPGVGADTRPPDVTLELRLPLSTLGQLQGSDTVTCKVRRDWWVFPH